MAFGHPHAVEVEAVDSGSSFVQHHPDLVADLDLDGGCGDDAVVGPRLDDLAGLDLPVDDLAPSGRTPWCRRPAPSGPDPRHRGPPSRPGTGWRRPPSTASICLRAHGRRRRATCADPVGRPAAPDVEHPRHAARGVPGDRADHLVGALGQHRPGPGGPSRRAGCPRSACRATGRRCCGPASRCSSSRWTTGPAPTSGMAGSILRSARVELHHRGVAGGGRASSRRRVVPLQSSSRTTKRAPKARSSAPTATHDGDQGDRGPVGVIHGVRA